jgi:DNA uptake protein ComE-like DNA-binding protein
VTPARRRRAPWVWTAPQRGVIVFLLVAMLVYLAARYLRNPMFVSDPQPRDPPRAVELADRIDPNTADWQTLAALPMIGQKRARDIIAYRERFAAQNPGKPAFSRIEDLYRVRGFGVSMVEHMRPYLTFPRRSPTSVPD